MGAGADKKDGDDPKDGDAPETPAEKEFDINLSVGETTTLETGYITDDPEDVLVCGFDNSPEATIIEPNLTTIKIHSSSMGYTAADLLLARIATPSMPYKKTYIETDIIYRQSTGSIQNHQ